MECQDVRLAYSDIEFEPCCISCHEDDDMGYGEDLWFEIDGKDRHICCSTHRGYLAGIRQRDVSNSKDSH